MIRCPNLHTVIGGVGAQVSPIADEVAGGARVEEAGVPRGGETGQNITGRGAIPHLDDGRTRQVIIPGRPRIRGGDVCKSSEWRRCRCRSG